MWHKNFMDNIQTLFSLIPWLFKGREKKDLVTTACACTSFIRCGILSCHNCYLPSRKVLGIISSSLCTGAIATPTISSKGICHHTVVTVLLESAFCSQRHVHPHDRVASYLAVLYYAVLILEAIHPCHFFQIRVLLYLVGS